jgi:general secretion pathway protein N
MKRIVWWSLAAIISVLLTIAISFPASWLAPFIERHTHNQFSLGDAQGTLWSGSAYLVTINPSQSSPARSVPGRFEWALSPWIVLGKLDASISNPLLLENVLMVSGSWRRWHLSNVNLRLPASQLSLLGTPFNTLKPSGQMRLSAPSITLISHSDELEILGAMQLQLNDIASVLSPVKPLGNYRMEFEWQGSRAQLTLVTLSGPLQLKGRGELINGHVHFSGQAWAVPAEEGRLANCLNLLGRRHEIDNHHVFVIEIT